MFTYRINVTSFLVFHTKETVSIGLKNVIRVVTSIIQKFKMKFGIPEKKLKDSLSNYNEVSSLEKKNEVSNHNARRGGGNVKRKHRFLLS